MDLGAPELLIILVVVLVLFGGKKLPDLARSLGAAKREFQEGQNDAKDGDAKADEEKKA
jgi:sec-independent protein translocase protein TatA